MYCQDWFLLSAVREKLFSASSQALLVCQHSLELFGLYVYPLHFCHHLRMEFFLCLFRSICIFITVSKCRFFTRTAVILIRIHSMILFLLYYHCKDSISKKDYILRSQGLVVQYMQSITASIDLLHKYKREISPWMTITGFR